MCCTHGCTWLLCAGGIAFLFVLEWHSQRQCHKCAEAPLFLLIQHIKGVKNKQVKLRQLYRPVSHPPKQRLSDAVGWLQRSKMLCSTCSLIMPYFRTKEQSDYALKATWSKEFRKSLLNHFPRCFYQTVLGQIRPFSLNSLSHSISLLLLKSIHKQKIKTFPKEMTTLTHYLVELSAIKDLHLLYVNVLSLSQA